jgi:hypothetical protein
MNLGCSVGSSTNWGSRPWSTKQPGCQASSNWPPPLPLELPWSWFSTHKWTHFCLQANFDKREGKERVKLPLNVAFFACETSQSAHSYLPLLGCPAYRISTVLALQFSVFTRRYIPEAQPVTVTGTFRAPGGFLHHRREKESGGGLTRWSVQQPFFFVRLARESPDLPTVE